MKDLRHTKKHYSFFSIFTGWLLFLFAKSGNSTPKASNLKKVKMQSKLTQDD